MTILSIGMGSATAGILIEADFGDFSDDKLAPSALTIDVGGSNQILGNMGSPDIQDWITFTVPTGAELTGILINNYDDTATPGVENDGNRGWHSLTPGPIGADPLVSSEIENILGGAHLDPVTPPGSDTLGILAASTVSSDISGFTTPLPAGDYTYLVQQTGPDNTDYDISFVVTAVPEPSFFGGLIGLAVLVVASAARRRAEK